MKLALRLTYSGIWAPLPTSMTAEVQQVQRLDLGGDGTMQQMIQQGSRSSPSKGGLAVLIFIIVHKIISA